MNTQFRKGVIEMCVLALIERKDMYGYEIVQSIAYYTEINEGTVYPIPVSYTHLHAVSVVLPIRYQWRSVQLEDRPWV